MAQNLYLSVIVIYAVMEKRMGQKMLQRYHIINVGRNIAAAVVGKMAHHGTKRFQTANKSSL